jgi:tight adherence protein B
MWPRSRVTERKDGGALGRAHERLAQAGLARVGIPTLVVVSVILGVAASAVVFALVPVVAAAVAAGLLVLALPWLVVIWRARAARRATRVVWPDVVDHLVSAVRSGLALPDSVVTLAHTGPPATRVAFAEFERDYRMSGSFADSLDRLKDRLVDPVADRIIETLRMSREVGGNELTTVLRNLASYLRSDAAVRSEVEARQSWVVNAARLGVAAPWIVLILLSSRPEAAAAYNTPEGAMVIGVGLVLSVIAYRIMLGIGRLPEEKRWFG